MKNKVYVGSIPETLSETELRKQFSVFGKVRNSYICFKNKKNSFLYGFVEFFKEAQAAECVSRGELVLPSGHKLALKPTFSRPELSDSKSPKQEKDLFRRLDTLDPKRMNLADANFLSYQQPNHVIIPHEGHPFFSDELMPRCRPLKETLLNPWLAKAISQRHLQCDVIMARDYMGAPRMLLMTSD